MRGQGFTTIEKITMFKSRPVVSKSCDQHTVQRIGWLGYRFDADWHRPPHVSRGLLRRGGQKRTLEGRQGSHLGLHVLRVQVRRNRDELEAIQMAVGRLDNGRYGTWISERSRPFVKGRDRLGEGSV
jgi:hypothetical protein